jgi:hypothetical protein
MIKNNIYPRIDKIFPSQKMNMIKSIFNYIDKNHEILKSATLTYRPSFSDTDREAVFNAMGISAGEMLEEIKKSKDIDGDRNISGNPFYIACILLAGYCLNKKDDATAKLLIVYMSINMYTSIHFKYVKFNATEEVMNYTISKLDNSYDLKKEGTLLKLIESNTETVINTYRNDLLKSEDDRLGYFANAVHTRLNSKIKKVFNRYYKYKDSGEYLNLDSESNIPDEYRVISNDYQAISALANKVFINFIMGKIPREVTKFAIVGTDVSETKFNTLVADIKEEDDDAAMRSFIMHMITYAVYYNQMPFQYISTGKYLTIMKSGYTSNTNSEEMRKIKEQLDTWINDNASKYGRTSYGKTAANGYKKAIYNYFMYSIYNDAK